jgi:hypothetical protein
MKTLSLQGASFTCILVKSLCSREHDERKLVIHRMTRRWNVKYLFNKYLLSAYMCKMVAERTESPGNWGRDVFLEPLFT